MVEQALENFSVKKRRVVRELKLGERVWSSAIENKAPGEVDGHSAWWQSFLRGAKMLHSQDSVDMRPLRAVDAFSGCGGLTLGVTQAALAVGRQLHSIAAIDVDEGGLAVHQSNFNDTHALATSVSSVVDFHVSGSGDASRFAYEPEVIHPALAGEAGNIDVLLAGPPCQGHSNLNNRTRREDPRNLLYLTAVALAVALKSRFVIIENVPEVVSDRSNVVVTAKALLRSSGYKFIDSSVLAAHEMGWPQTRKRFFLIAAFDSKKSVGLTLSGAAAGLKRKPYGLGWAIGDLVESAGDIDRAGVMDSVPVLSEENLARIAWLFENDKHNLPNEERPDCHKDGHSYPSVYGRMYWDRPAQTITTGFLTPGRGRYIHPLVPRVITPREAARIQAFPDNFRFVVNGHDPARTSLSKWIGDAVPPVLGYAAALPLLTTL